MAKNKLSIYLIKEGIDAENIFNKDYDVNILKTYTENKKVYYIASSIHSPNWLENFFGFKDDDLLQASSRAILIDKINIDDKERIFALTFGYSKNMFADDVLEEQFGLKIVLNSVGTNDIRKIAKISVGSNQKQTQEQMPKAANIAEFGFDVERDLIKNVTGKCEIEEFEKAHLIGGDIFSLLVDRNVDNIDDFLKFCYKKYKEEIYKENFEWIDNIKEIKSKTEKDNLDIALIEYIKQEKYDCVWSTIPEVIEWENISGFRYQGDSQIYDDIHIEKVISTFSKELTNVQQLKNKKIIMVDANGEEVGNWSFYKCIVAEIEIGGISYCLNNGKWYYINKDYSQIVEREYESIELLDKDFIKYTNDMNNEDDYNEKLASELGNAYLIHKIGEIPYGGGKGNKIEVCDVMTDNKELMHIKKNGSSACLSHLFNQATVASELLMDKAFRTKANNKMKEKGFKISFPEQYSTSDYTIIIGIINKYEDERPKIPFFSKVSIRYTINSLKRLGYKVKLKNITRE